MCLTFSQVIFRHSGCLYVCIMQCALMTVADEQSNNMQYVDLLKNPERYTGYKGFSPHRIWRAVYDENCFKYVQVF